MPMDGITIGLIARELHSSLQGGRVDKVQQPEKDELILHIRSAGKNHRILLSASANHARIHETSVVRENPIQAPMFCMLLRKHLGGGRVLAVRQPTSDRILEMDFETVDEMGEAGLRTLVIEIMGRHSNIILVDGTRRILDSIKHVTPDMSRVREVLPGLPYSPPPGQQKADTHKLTLETAQALFSAGFEGLLSKKLSSGLSGVSLVSAKEIAVRIAGEDDPLQAISEDTRAQLPQRLCAFYEQLPTLTAPTLLVSESGTPLDILAFPYKSIDATRQQPRATLSEAVDDYYLLRDRAERISQRTAALSKSLQTHLERKVKKHGILLQTLQDSAQMDQHRIYGDLIMSNLYQIQRGDRVAQVENYYDPENPTVKIPLDVQLAPAENAQRYYKRYSKAKAASIAAAGQLKVAAEDIQWLENQLDNVGKCVHMAELNEIRLEMIQEGYLRPTAKDKVKRGAKGPTSKPYTYRTSDGFILYVGKNNSQNDRLTGKAAPTDIWLHAKDIPGSHVILVTGGREASEAALFEAAVLAAHYSKGKVSENVPVDYCQRRYVKKPNGAKPGYVIFTHNKTLHVTPSDTVLRNLLLVEE